MKDTIRNMITAADAIRMNIPPIVIGPNIFLIIFAASASVLLPDEPIAPAIMLLNPDGDKMDLYIAVMDVKKQPTNPNTEEATVIIEIIFSFDFVMISIAA